MVFNEKMTLFAQKAFVNNLSDQESLVKTSQVITDLRHQASVCTGTDVSTLDLAIGQIFPSVATDLSGQQAF